MRDIASANRLHLICIPLPATAAAAIAAAASGALFPEPSISAAFCEGPQEPRGAGEGTNAGEGV